MSRSATEEPDVQDLFERLRDEHAWPEAVDFHYQVAERELTFAIEGTDRGVRVTRNDDGDLQVEVTAPAPGHDRPLALSVQTMTGPPEAQAEQALAAVLMVVAALLPPPPPPNPSFAVAFRVEQVGPNPSGTDPMERRYQLFCDGVVLGGIEVLGLRVTRAEVRPDPAAVFPDL
jgi:hypothetical protein